MMMTRNHSPKNEKTAPRIGMPNCDPATCFRGKNSLFLLSRESKHSVSYRECSSDSEYAIPASCNLRDSLQPLDQPSAPINQPLTTVLPTLPCLHLSHHHLGRLRGPRPFRLAQQLDLPHFHRLHLRPHPRPTPVKHRLQLLRFLPANGLHCSVFGLKLFRPSKIIILSNRKYHFVILSPPLQPVWPIYTPIRTPNVPILQHIIIHLCD